MLTVYEIVEAGNEGTRHIIFVATDTLAYTLVSQLGENYSVRPVHVTGTLPEAEACLSAFRMR
jgi:hypothetical protein